MLGGVGRLVFLTGEAGIGKSALAEEFMRSVRGLHPGLMLASGRAVEQYGTGEAYLPFLDALSTLLRDGGDSLPAMLRAHAPPGAYGFRPSVPAVIWTNCAAKPSATKDRMLREMGDALGVLSSTAIAHCWRTCTGPAIHNRPAPHLPRIAARPCCCWLHVVEDIQIGSHPLKTAD
jgi:hypothetical protein